MKPILSIALKDLKLLFRDHFSLFWIFAFPVAFALFFGIIFGDEDGGGGRGAISLAAVDEDASAASRALLEQLAANASLRIERTGEEANAPVRTATLAAAREAVQKGRRAAFVRIPKGYGDNPYAVFGAGDADVPRIEIGIDPGRRAEAGFLQGVLMEAVFSALRERFLDQEVMRADLRAARDEVARADDLDGVERLALQALLGAVDVFFSQVDVKTLGAAAGGSGETSGGSFGPGFDVVDVTRDQQRGPRSAFDITFPQALVWGLMSVAMSFAILLVRERTAGTLVRLRMAPIRPAQLLAGKALACFAGCMITMAALLGFSAVALGVRFDSLPLLFLAMVATAVCFTGLTMTISVLGKSENAVAGSAWGVMMPFVMVGGGMIPLIAMPDWLQTASAFSPFRWAITAVEGATWRGFAPADMLLPCGVLVATGVLFFVVGALIFRRVSASD